ncbi:hypothetical protein BDR22DRAFT_614516 [Usnea florida]
MLQTIIQYFALFLPHTYARLAHWHILLFYDNIGLFDLQSVILVTLPFSIHIILRFAAAYRLREDDLRVVKDFMRYGYLVYKALDLLAVLKIVLKASGFWRKAMLAIDLFVECTLVLLAKRVVFASVGVSVRVALESLPYAKKLMISSWMLSVSTWMLLVYLCDFVRVLIRVAVLELQGRLEELPEDDKVHAEEQIGEKEASKEEEVL